MRIILTLFCHLRHFSVKDLFIKVKFLDGCWCQFHLHISAYMLIFVRNVLLIDKQTTVFSLRKFASSPQYISWWSMSELIQHTYQFLLFGTFRAGIITIKYWRSPIYCTFLFELKSNFISTFIAVINVRKQKLTT